MDSHGSFFISSLQKFRCRRAAVPAVQGTVSGGGTEESRGSPQASSQVRFLQESRSRQDTGVSVCLNLCNNKKGVTILILKINPKNITCESFSAKIIYVYISANCIYV